MRLFIAIEIDDKLRDKLASAQAGLRQISGIKWVEPKNFHLTLKFLGETDQGTASRLANRIGEVASGFRPFGLKFGGFGVFPDARRPRVVWVGIKRGLQALFALAQKVEEESQQLGFEAEKRPFSAHLTLGRARGIISAAALSADLKRLSEDEFDEISVEHITIMESTLTRAGPIYTPRNKLLLGQS